jgi:hypothetical protein
MNFTTLKNYLVKKIDSSKLQILSKEQENKTGIKNLRLNRYTKRGIKYILPRISEFIEKGSTEKKKHLSIGLWKKMMLNILLKISC